MTLKKFYLLSFLLTTMLPAAVIGQCTFALYQSSAFNCDNGSTASARLTYSGTGPVSVAVTKVGSSVTNTFVFQDPIVVIDNLEPNATYNVVATNPCGTVTTSITPGDYPDFVPSNTSTPCIDEPYEVCFPVFPGASITWTNVDRDLVLGKMGPCFSTPNYPSWWNANYNVSINYVSGCVVRDYDLPLFGVDCTTLPVKLVDFTAKVVENQSMLSWSTSEETNSDHFDVQRSADGKIWKSLGVIASAKESSSIKQYGFTDARPLGGLNYYRLKMVDLDGTFTYSQIRTVNLEGMPAIAIYPNPAAGKVYLQNIDLGTVTKVSINSIDGKYVYNYTSVTSNGIDVGNLTPGLYVLSITGQGQVQKPIKLLITK